jgi:hypothetical protein
MIGELHLEVCPTSEQISSVLLLRLRRFLHVGDGCWDLDRLGRAVHREITIDQH